MNPKYIDRFNEAVVLGNKFILYRNRSIPFSEMKEFRVKNNRFLINHFKNNTGLPTMCIFFQNKERAAFFHDEILNKVFYQQ